MLVLEKLKNWWKSWLGKGQPIDDATTYPNHDGEFPDEPRHPHWPDDSGGLHFETTDTSDVHHLDAADSTDFSFDTTDSTGDDF